MSENEKTVVQDRRSQLSLRSLNLDPNNYRFRDSELYSPVLESEAISPEVQRRTAVLIAGKSYENLKDLIDSFRKNGFLPVDQIQVKRIDDSGKFLVVEGNRRIAALKHLQSRYESEGFDIGRLDPEIFSKVPVIYYNDADESHHLVLMGLKHISGNKKWPAINQAELIRTLHDQHQLSIVAICQSIGIAQNEVTATLQTLALIDHYKNSIYGDQFKSDKYSIFREIIRNRKIKNWLEWDDANKRARRSDNLERMFSWISEEFVADDDDDAEDELIGAGQKLEPILIRSAQVRDLAKIIDDEQALSNLDVTRNLAEATLSSDVLGKDKVKNAISIVSQELNAIFNMSRLIADSDRADIAHLQEKIRSLLSIGQAQPLDGAARQMHVYNSSISKFSKISITNFRHLSSIELNDLRRINLIAGLNNSGKTSILEAIKLLCSLNDAREFTDLVRRRAKLNAEQVDMSWFLEQIPECSLTGVYDAKPVALNVVSENLSMEDMTYYLSTVNFDVSVDDRNWGSQVHFFERYPQRSEGFAGSLCPSIFSSPFNILEPSLLADCHSKSLREGSKEIVISFIRQYIDSDIKNIELDDHGRYTVIHEKIKPNPDLTMFGEGIQRIFKLGMLFAGAKDGVLVIDEFENAIHASLLPRVIELLYQLCLKFNVQLFVTSHSKECIDAFALSDIIPKNEISAYALINTGKIEAVHFTGERLSTLVSAVDFDIRGKK